MIEILVVLAVIYAILVRRDAEALRAPRVSVRSRRTPARFWRRGPRMAPSYDIHPGLSRGRALVAALAPRQLAGRLAQAWHRAESAALRAMVMQSPGVAAVGMVHRIPEEIDLRDYEAALDGVTDDTAELAAAVASASVGDCLVIPYGKNLYVTDTTVIATAGLTFTGGGTITVGANAKNIFTVTANYVKFVDIKFVGTGVTGNESTLPGSYGAAIAFKQCRGGVVERCHFDACPGTVSGGVGTDSGAAVWLTSSSECRITNNYFEDCFMAVNDDVFYGASTGTRGNLIAHNDIVGGTRGIVVDYQGVDTNVPGGRVESNNINGTSGNSIEIDDCDHGFTVALNDIYGGGANGIVLQRRCRGGVVSGNKVRGCTNAGLVINPISGGNESQGVTVSANVFHGNEDGALLYSCYRITFEGNHFTENTRNGVRTATGSFPQQVSFSGGSSYKNAQHGFYVVDALDWTIMGVQVSLNGQSASGTYDGIHFIDSAITPARVNVVACRMDTGLVETQRYAINWAAAVGERVYCIGNQTTGQVTGEINDAWGSVQKIGNGTVANVLVQALGIDTINERTADAGVTVDGLEIKDRSIGTSDGTLGFFGKAAAARPDAYTVNYATVSRVLANYVSDAESAAYTGQNNLDGGATYAKVADLNTLRVAYENLRASHESLLAVVAQMIADDKTLGLKQ